VKVFWQSCAWTSAWTKWLSGYYFARREASTEKRAKGTAPHYFGQQKRVFD
jgi:hypothetical protein